MTPTCPGPWYQGPGGLVVVILGIVAVVIVVCVALFWAHEWSSEKRKAKERELDRRHKLAIEEQRSVQADSAKGSIEFLQVLRSDR